MPRGADAASNTVLTDAEPSVVIAGLDPAIHLLANKGWMRGSSPRMTWRGWFRRVGCDSSQRQLPSCARTSGGRLSASTPRRPASTEAQAPAPGSRTRLRRRPHDAARRRRIPHAVAPAALLRHRGSARLSRLATILASAEMNLRFCSSTSVPNSGRTNTALANKWIVKTTPLFAMRWPRPDRTSCGLARSRRPSNSGSRPYDVQHVQTSFHRLYCNPDWYCCHHTYASEKPHD